MVKIIGVRFRNAGKVYYFDPLEFTPARGSRVIVETARGVECGKVVMTAREVDESKVVQPLRPVIRMATEEDVRTEWENYAREKDAYRICQQKIREHGLDMKLVQAEYTFDNKKVLFYFTADGRIDFRDLVKDLASVFKTRIELRQIGVRDETKMLGGIGICGRPLCCSTYLSDFAPVSIKMAKEQNLSLNPTKISGACGRLMCCLKNEEDTYEYLNQKLPGIGDTVETPDGRIGDVHAVNVLRQRVRVLIEEGDDKEIEEFPAEELSLILKRKKGGQKGKEAAIREALERRAEQRAAQQAADAEEETAVIQTESDMEMIAVSTGDGELVVAEHVHTEETQFVSEHEQSESGRRRRDRERTEGRRGSRGDRQEGEQKENSRRRDRNRKAAAEAEDSPAENRTEEKTAGNEGGSGENGSGEKRRRRRNRRPKDRQEGAAGRPEKELADTGKRPAGDGGAAPEKENKGRPDPEKASGGEGASAEGGTGEKRRRRRNRRPRRNKGAAEATHDTVEA